MKDFKKIEDIVTYYKSIEQSNLFKNEEFTINEFGIINQSILEENKKYITFLREKITTNKINVKSLQAIVNELLDLYHSLHSDIIHNHIPEIEQTPLFRYEISPDYKALKTGYSAIAVSNKLADLINQLKNDYPHDIKLEEKLKILGHAAPYLDDEGYYRHIFFKMISPDFLSKECYNKKDMQVKKINEFLDTFTENPLQLPISFDIIKDKTDETDKYIQETNDSQTFINQAFELFPDEINIPDFENKQNESINEADESEIVFPIIRINVEDNLMDEALDLIVELFNSLKENGIVDKVEEEKIRTIFSEKYSDTHIIWGKANSLRYFINQIEYAYGLIIISENKWDSVCHYFWKNENEKFTPDNLSSNKSFSSKSLIENPLKDFQRKMKSLQK